jgi:hypothetical protein
MDPRMPDPYTLPQDDVTLAHKLVAMGGRLFPRTFSWFIRAKVQDETAAEIAAEANVSPGYVRSEVSGIARALRAIGNGAPIVMVVFAVLFGLHRWASDDGGTANPPPPPPVHPEPRTPEELRDVANGECAHQAWAACLDHLTRASTLDPAGETPAWKELRVRADRKLHELDAAPAP